MYRLASVRAAQYHESMRQAPCARGRTGLVLVVLPQAVSADGLKAEKTSEKRLKVGGRFGRRAGQTRGRLGRRRAWGHATGIPCDPTPPPYCCGLYGRQTASPPSTGNFFPTRIFKFQQENRIFQSGNFLGSYVRVRAYVRADLRTGARGSMPPPQKSFSTALCPDRGSPLVCENFAPIGDFRTIGEFPPNENPGPPEISPKWESGHYCNALEIEVDAMPQAAKMSSNIKKHLSRAELEARQQAEVEFLPQRQKLKLKKPSFVSGNRQTNAYWNQILKRMEGLALLDDLDSEMLAGYCSMLSRRDETILLVSQLTERMGVVDMEPDETLAAMSKLNGLHGKLRTLDRTLLQYAEKLGLTPSGRVRLAQKRAQAATDQDPDSDLFGD